MATFQIPWTSGFFSINVLDRNIETVVTPKNMPILGERIDLVRHALEKPRGCPPIQDAVQSSFRVALLITDSMDRYMGPPHNIGPYRYSP